jgi:hypothetical protein
VKPSLLVRRRLSRRGLVALLALGALAIAWPVGAFGTSSPSEEAQQLLARARQAAVSHDFTGLATLKWRDGATERTAQVDVTDAAGMVEARVDGNVVYDHGDRTYFEDDGHWTGIAVEPGNRDVPSAGAHWKLTTRPGPEIAGRSTTEIVATRRDGEGAGKVAQRIAVDDDTGLLLRRQVLGLDGTVEHSMTFTELDLGAAATQVTAPAGLRTEESSKITTMPDGYKAPDALHGAALVTRTKQSDGVMLWYSDGLFTTTVSEQRGDLDWDALPPGGTTSQVMGSTVRRWSEPSGTVLVWEHDGVVYTCVSDAPSDIVEGAVASLAAPERSALERAADFVLGPFGWN